MIKFVSVEKGINSETFAPCLMICVAVPLELVVDERNIGRKNLAMKVGTAFLDELERMDKNRA